MLLSRGLVIFVLATCAAFAADLLTAFQPSSVRSDYGAVSEIEFRTDLIELEPGALAEHPPQAMRNFRVAEPIWVIGYRTEIADQRGVTPRENFLCHTFFGDQRVTQHDDQEIKGIYSDAFTPEVRLPSGFGIPLTPDENLHWMPMFNNREPRAVKVAMNVRLTLIRAKDLKKPLTPLYSTLRSVHLPHLYFVPAGRHQQSATFVMPFDARMHFLGTHIHPHGVSIELFNVSRQERVWEGKRKLDGDRMEVYSSAEGYAVRSGDTYRITATYDNPTKAPIDAMAGLYILYARP